MRPTQNQTHEYLSWQITLHVQKPQLKRISAFEAVFKPIGKVFTAFSKFIVESQTDSWLCVKNYTQTLTYIEMAES